MYQEFASLRDLRPRWVWSVVALAPLLASSCAQIADPDNIKVAKIDGKFISRGDIYELLFDMADAERPKVNSRQDLLRVLNQEIDRRIKLPLGQQLKAEGKIDVPREVARQQFFQEGGDEAQMYRTIWEMEVPENGEITPLMEAYNLTSETMSSMKEVVELKTDLIMDVMLGDQAVAYLAAEDYKAGNLTLDPKMLEMEYNFRKSELMKFEWMEFVAIRFPESQADSVAAAAEVRTRIDNGESFDDLVNEFLQKYPGSVMQSEIENNPGLARFVNFWNAASGASPGDIIGPVYMPQYTQQVQDAQGRIQQKVMPDSYLVFKVLQHRPETVMTLEEATPLIAPTLLISGEMKKLREEHGVEVYEDKLPNPGGDGTFKDLKVDF